ncbi:hypothetical protein N9900_01225, partial [bacterium]|nr:hypothetical protein [bacterium]
VLKSPRKLVVELPQEPSSKVGVAPEKSSVLTPLAVTLSSREFFGFVEKKATIETRWDVVFIFMALLPRDTSDAQLLTDVSA